MRNVPLMAVLVIKQKIFQKIPFPAGRIGTLGTPGTMTGPAEKMTHGILPTFD